MPGYDSIYRGIIDGTKSIHCNYFLESNKYSN